MRPTYLGIGPPRTGSSSIFRVLRIHPHIEQTIEKELHWFDREDWVLTPESLAKYESNWSDLVTTVRGEITPNYILYPDRILPVYPDIKYIITWRDPVERLLSHLRAGFVWGHLRGEVKLSEKAAYRETFLRKFEEQIANGDFNSQDVIRYSRKNILKPWQDALSEDQLLVIQFEEFANPKTHQAVVERVLKFLGVPPLYSTGRKSFHLNSLPSEEKVILKPETITALREYFNSYE